MESGGYQNLIGGQRTAGNGCNLLKSIDRFTGQKIQLSTTIQSAA
jgi:hypothetical protein